MDFSLMIKFFKEEEHLMQFKSGKLFCNTFKYFRELENDEGTRCDPNEGVKSRKNIFNGVMQFRAADSPNEASKTLNFENGLFTEYYSGNIFCISRFGIEPKEDVSQFIIDNKFNVFGDYYAILMNQPIFYDMLQEAIKTHKYSADGKEVEYVDLEDLNKERSPFKKRKDFSWQSEYRVHFKSDSPTPITINLGDISNIIQTGRLSMQNVFDFKFQYL